MFLLRIRARSEEIEANGVPVEQVFAAGPRFDSLAISSSARDSRPYAEFRLATIQAQRATNLERESQPRKPAVA